MEDVIDMKDKRILSALEEDARQSLRQIAKKAGLKKETVFHRIQRLEDKEIIKNYLTEIDVYRLGFQFYPLLIKFQDTTPEIEQKIFTYFKNSPYTAWLAKTEGSWDLNAALITKETRTLNDFINDLMHRHSNYISDKNILIITDIQYFKRTFLPKKKKTHAVAVSKENVRVSEEELNLLTAISNNAKASFVDLAELLGTTPKTISYRFKKLEQKKVIQGSRVLLDMRKLGYKMYKIWFSLKGNRHNLKELFAYLENNSSITWVTKTIGTYDLSCEMEVKSTQEFRDIVAEIKKRFSHLIKSHESLLIYEETMMNYLPEHTS